MKTFVIMLIGAAASLLMGLLDYTAVITVPNWEDWVPFGIGAVIFLLAHAGVIVIELFGDIIEAIFDGISS